MRRKEREKSSLKREMLLKLRAHSVTSQPEQALEGDTAKRLSDSRPLTKKRVHLLARRLS